MTRSRYLLIVWLVILLTACGVQAPAHEIRFAIAQAPLNLDPRYATDAASERVNRLIYQPLIDFDAASKPKPALATWKQLSDTEYQFTLQHHRTPFHHQQKLTAADVKATYDSLLELADSPHRAEFSNLKQTKILDEENIVFQLKQSDTHFPEKLIIGILPKNLIEKQHDFSHHPIGNGALQFLAWDHKLTLKRTRDGQIITLQEVKDPTVRILKLQRGETDLLQGDLPPEMVKYLKNQSDIRVKHSIGTNFSYLGLNLQDPILQQHPVRLALAHAIDRNAIIEKVMVKNTRPATMILPPEHYAGNANLTPHAYNPALAKQLLQEAGIQLPLKLVYKTSTDAQRVRLATILQAQMAAAGIQLEIKSLDWGTFFADVKQGQFQLFGLTWVGIKTPEIYTKAFSSQFFPPNGFNRGRYADTKLDALLAQEKWPAATSHIHTQLPYIPLWYEGQFAAMQKNITDYTPKPDGNWDDLASIKRSATIPYAH